MTTTLPDRSSQRAPRTDTARSEKSRAIYGAMCTYRRPDDLWTSLDVLSAQSRSLDGLVIVDNGCDPEVVDLVQRHPLASRIPIDVLSAGANLGPAGGYELAYTRIDELAEQHDLLLILDDDDPPPTSSAIAELERAADEAFTDSTVAGVGLRGGELNLGSGVIASRPTGPHTQGADHLHGGWLPLYRMDALRSTNVFDGDFFWGFDDLELGRRLARAGWSVKVAGEVFCSMGSPNRPSWSTALATPSWRHYFRHRNLLRVLVRDRAWGAVITMLAARLLAKPIANLPRSPRLAFWHLRTNTEAAIDGLAFTNLFEKRHRPS